MPTKLSHQQSLVPDVAGDVATKSFVEGLSGVSDGDYIHAYNSLVQDDLVADTVVAIDTVQSSRGGLALSGNQITGLKAGRHYMLIGIMRVEHTASFFASFKFWDVTQNAQLVNHTHWTIFSASATSHAGYGQTGLAFFVPDVDTTVELRCQGGTAGIDLFTANSFKVIEIGATVVNGVSGLEFMDIIEVTADQTSVSFGAGGDGAFQRVLDGDVDEEYILSYHLPDTTAGITLRPNSIDPAVDTTFDSSTSLGGQSAVNVEQDDWKINAQSAGYLESGDLHIQAKTGIIRSFTGQSSVINAGVAGRFTSTMAGQWENTVINFTSLQIFSSIADGIKIGARFVLWRRTSGTPLRADNAAIYERNVEATVAQGTLGAVTYTGGRANFGGSAVGIGIELVDDTVVSGSVDAVLKIDGVAVLTATLDSVNTSFARAAAATGVHAILAGHTVEIDISTTSLVTTGAGTPAIVVNATLTNNAFILEAIPSVGPDYLAGRLATTQSSNVDNGDHVEWDAFSVRGGITFSAGSGQQLGLITLPPFKTYEIYCNLRAIINEGTGIWQWYDDLGSVIVDDTGTVSPAILLTDNHGTDNAEMTGSVMLFTPTVETTMRLRITSDTNIVSLHVSCNLLIKELR